MEKLNIQKAVNGNELIFVLSGRLDTTTSPKFDEEIKASVAGMTRLAIDMGGLEYISSSGLRVILSAQKIMNKQGEMIVKGPNESIMEVFDVTGFTDILTIEA